MTGQGSPDEDNCCVFRAVDGTTLLYHGAPGLAGCGGGKARTRGGKNKLGGHAPAQYKTVRKQEEREAKLAKRGLSKRRLAAQ